MLEGGRIGDDDRLGAVALESLGDAADAVSGDEEVEAAAGLGADLLGEGDGREGRLLELAGLLLGHDEDFGHGGCSLGAWMGLGSRTD